MGNATLRYDEERLLRWIRLCEEEGRGLPDIGQFSEAERNALRRLIRKGLVQTEKGYWPYGTYGTKRTTFYRTVAG